MSKHTPGPWRKGAANDCHKIFSAGREVAFVHGSTRGRRVSPLHAEAQANARLIAAAPEMKTLLENCVVLLRTAAVQADNSSIDRTIDGEKLRTRGLADTLKSLADSCAAIIAKAEGAE